MDHMVYTEYAAEQDERDMGLEYTNPRPRFLEKVEEDLRIIADRLGHEPPEIQAPEKGFLTKPLLAHQRRRLNTLLAPQLALRMMEKQRDLKRVPIVECNEPMVLLTEVLAEKSLRSTTSEKLFHDACGTYAAKQRILYVRREVAERFAHVTRALHELNLMPHIEDCWRPWQVQKGLLIRRVVDLAREHTEWDWRTVKSVASSFTATSPGLAGHQAGAAVDARIRRMDKDRGFLHLGNEYTEGGVYSAFNSPHVTASQWRTRMYFITAMTRAGFKLLSTENWHGSFGDRGMSPSGDVTMSLARYGPIAGFSANNGKISGYSRQLIEATYMTDEQYEQLVHMSREEGGGNATYAHSAPALYAQFLAEEPRKQGELPKKC